VFRLLKAGGLLCFDDYEWDQPGRHHPPQPAIDAFLTLWGHRLEVLDVAYQVWVRSLG